MLKKSVIAYILILCILVGQTVPISQARASEVTDVNLSDQLSERATEKKDEMQKMLSFLSRYEFFGDMTSDEQKKITDFYGVDGELIIFLEKTGIGLPDSLNLSSMNKVLEFGPDELITLYKSYISMEKLIEAVMEFDLCLTKYSLDKNVKKQLKPYLLEGYDPKNIVSSYVVATVLKIPPEELLLKGEREEQDMDSSFYERYEVNNDVLNAYIAGRGITLEEIDSLVTQTFLQDNGILLSGEEQEVQYTKYLQNPYRFNENTNEIISPNNGSLIYEINSVHLEGKNGLDLDITARYRLSDAHLYLYDYRYVPKYYIDTICLNEVFYASDSGYFELVRSDLSYPIFSGYHPDEPYAAASNYEVYFQSGPIYRNGFECYYYYIRQIVWVSDLYMQYVVENGTDPHTYFDKIYNLGTGWGFAFSSIESYVEDKYLHLSSGEAYKVEITDTAGDSNLKDYPLKDIRLEPDSGSYSGPGGVSAYILYYKDGKKEYFNSDGRLLAIQDRFSNTITFYYETFNGNTVIDKIIDTAGRTVEFTYVQLENEQRIILTLPDNNTVTYVLQKIPGQTDNYNLISVIDPAGRTTAFQYEV
jgi:hypothetical protein